MIKKYPQNKKPFIFNKKINDNNKMVSFNLIKNTLGPIKHSPISTKEWFNSIYYYNNNSVKNLTIADKNLSSIINSYFNLYFNNTSLNSNSITTRLRRLAVNKIFFSKAELKHTNSKVLITLYVYNQERIDLINKIKLVESLLFSLQEKTLDLSIKVNHLSLKEKLDIINNSEYITSIANKQNKIELLVLKLIESLLYTLSIIRSLKTEKVNNLIIKNNVLELSNLLRNVLVISKSVFSKNIFEINKIYLEKEILTLSYYKLLLNLNKFKFEDKLLIKLIPLVSKIYNKEIEFNIINLKALYLNSDILTNVIALKLRNRNNKLLRVLKSSLSMIKLKINKPSENFHRLNIKELWINKVKNLNINRIINGHSLFFNKVNKDFFSIMFSYLFPNSSFISKNVHDKLNIENNNKIYKFILNTLKHKKMAGVRLEAKGRLTRRFTASRSVFKIKWKGSLKNIDATYRGLSSVILRGNIKSNVQYSTINSKTRNGAFGIKGWISGK